MIKVCTIFCVVFGFISCTNSSSSADAVKQQLYYAQGEALYQIHCSNCHQKNGKGLGLVYPPLDKSDFVDKNFAKVSCLIKYGISGEVMVNRKSFNQAMPGVRSLTELEIAELTTYIYNSWGRTQGMVTIDSVKRELEKCEP